MSQGWYFKGQVRDVVGPPLEPRDRLVAGSSTPGESDEVGIREHTLRRPHRVVMKCKAPWSLAAWLPILALKCTSYMYGFSALVYEMGVMLGPIQGPSSM